MKKLRLFLLLMIVVGICIGCSEKTTVESGKVHVVVSRDFGNEKLSDAVIDFSEDLSVMDAMEENFQIETAYGGGFINAIDGLKSGFTDTKDKKKTDWFYYVNGVLAEVGAADYYLNPNDIVVWDYHDWSNNMYVSSMIGAYPMNFVNGHGGNILKMEIIYETNYQKECEKLEEFLNEKGLKDIKKGSLSEENLKNGQIHSIVVGAWDQMIKLDPIKDFYQNTDKAGLFFKIENNIKAFDEKGEIAREFEKGAVITSIVKEYGLSGTLWLITGNDEACIKKAVKLLYENPEQIKGKFSVIITNDEMVNIPIKN